MINTTQTEAQKRATKKYRQKMKMWNCRIAPDLHEAIEKKRKKKGLTKKQVLEHFLREE